MKHVAKFKRLVKKVLLKGGASTHANRFENSENTAGIIVEILGAPGTKKHIVFPEVEKRLSYKWNTNIWLASTLLPVWTDRDAVDLFFLNLLELQFKRFRSEPRPFPHCLDVLAANARFLHMHRRIVTDRFSVGGWFLYEGIFHHFADEILALFESGVLNSEELPRLLGEKRAVIYLDVPGEEVKKNLIERSGENVFWNYVDVYKDSLDGFIDQAIQVRNKLIPYLSDCGYYTCRIATSGLSDREIANRILSSERHIVSKFGCISDSIKRSVA